MCNKLWLCHEVMCGQVSMSQGKSCGHNMCMYMYVIHVSIETNNSLRVHHGTHVSYPRSGLELYSGEAADNLQSRCLHQVPGHSLSERATQCDQGWGSASVEGQELCEHCTHSHTHTHTHTHMHTHTHTHTHNHGLFVLSSKVER